MQFEPKVNLGDDGLIFTLPPLPDEREIEGYQLPSAKQKFRRKIFPTQEEFNLLSRQYQKELINSELEKRINGHWIFVNGVPTWLAPSYYFFLNYWYMAAITEDGMPDYRWAQNKMAYFVELCERDESCFGAIFMSAKRFAKTEFFLAHLYNVATRGGFRYINNKLIPDENCLFGMQSLTHPEAKKNLFQGRILRSHRMIPNYLKPKSNDSRSRKELASELTFYGDKYGDDVTDALRNIIDHRPTVASAYQGKRPRMVYWDEPGTIEAMDIYDALTTVKQQCQIGKRAFGKMYLPATLENMTPKGAPLFEKIWDESDPSKRDANGRTESWLYRYFNPQYEGREDFIDEYGNSKVDEAKEFRANELAIKTAAGQKKVKRQYPETVDEAFDSVISNFFEEDVREILSEMKKRLRANAPPMKKILLYDLGGTIQHKPDKDGEMAVSVLEDPKPNVHYYAGFDGVASDKDTGAEEGSEVSVTIIKGADSGNEMEYCVVAYFKFRPQSMEDGYRLTQYLCRWYGQYGKLKLGIERNAGQGAPLIAHFVNRGLRKLLMRKQRIAGVLKDDSDNQYGWYRNGEVKDVQKSLTNAFLRAFGYNLSFLDLVESLIRYGTSNQDFADSFISAVYTMGMWEQKRQNDNRKGKTRMVYKGLRRNGMGYVEQVWQEVAI